MLTLLFFNIVVGLNALFLVPVIIVGFILGLLNRPYLVWCFESKYKVKYAGTFGDISIFTFYLANHITPDLAS
jgi:hypothetical protein